MFYWQSNKIFSSLNIQWKLAIVNWFTEFGSLWPKSYSCHFPLWPFYLMYVIQWYKIRGQHKLTQKNQPFFMSPNRKMLLTEKVHNISLGISLYYGKLATFPIRIHQENYMTVCFYHQEKLHLSLVSKKTSSKNQINWNSSCIFKEFRSEFCQKNQMASLNLWQFRPIVFKCEIGR